MQRPQNDLSRFHRVLAKALHSLGNCLFFYLETQTSILPSADSLHTHKVQTSLNYIPTFNLMPGSEHQPVTTIMQK